MTDGPRQRASTSGSAKDAAGEKESGGGGVALKKEIGLVSACGIIVGKSVLLSLLPESESVLWCDQLYHFNPTTIQLHTPTPTF